MPPRHDQNRDAALATRLDELTQQLGTVVQLLTAQAAAQQPHPAPVSRPPCIPPAAPEDFHRDLSSDDEETIDNPFAPLAGRPLRLRRDSRKWESGFKIDLPGFHGRLEPEEFIDWLTTVEDVLEFKDVPHDRRVSLVATRFHERAASWWKQHKNLHVRKGKDKIISWDKFTKHLRREFLPFNYARSLYQKLQNLRQGPRSIDAYTEEFYQLLARNDIDESDDQLISRYVGGLRL